MRFASFISLCFGLNTSGFAQATSVIATRPSAWHAELVSEMRYKIVREQVVSVPNMTVSSWGIVAGLPPELASQHIIRSAMTFPGHSGWVANVRNEVSKRHRPVLLGIQPANEPSLVHGYNVRVEYDVVFRRWDLRPGPSNASIQPLAAKERSLYTADDEQLNFRSGVVQDWLNRLGLSRSKGETDIEFTKRALHSIHNTNKYGDPERELKSMSSECRESKHSCGGFAWLLVTALRANGIPSRVLPGRLVGKDDDSVHVVTEAYFDGVGWFQIEATDESGEIVAPPPILVFHIDNGLVIEGWHDTTKLDWLQPIVNFPNAISGDWKDCKSKDTWRVSKEVIVPKSSG